MFSFLNRFTLAQKMVLIFVGSVFVPIIFQFFLLYTNVERNTEKEIEERLERTIENKVQAIEGNLSGVLTLMRKYEKNLQINQDLDYNYEFEKDYYENYNIIKNVLVADVPYHQQISYIGLYTNNPNIFYGGYVNRLQEDSEGLEYSAIHGDEEVISKYQDSLQKVTYVISTIMNKEQFLVERNISLIKTFDYFVQHNRYPKLLRIDLSLEHLSGLLQDVGFFEELIVVDGENRILFSSDKEVFKGELNTLKIEEIEKDYYLIERDIKDLPLKVYGIYNGKTFSQQFDDYRWYNILTALVSIIFASVFIYIIAGNIMRRTKKVVKLSEQIAEGKFVQLNEHEMKSNGRDEFYELEESMNRMSQQLKTLIDNEYKSKLVQVGLEKETAKAKLFALQSQVNPHFLYNALESIRLKAYANDETETATMIKHMAKMFRNLIQWEDEVIPLSEELSFLRQFLEIQKYRFEDEFSYEIKVDTTIQDIKIPKMIIQPLVENACIHGSTISGDVFAVRIRVFKKDQGLVIQVIDNGIGMTEDKLKEVRKNMEQEAYSKNVGVYNVYQRLKLFYKNQHSFSIESELNRGTTCTILIPKDLSEEQDQSTVIQLD